MAELIIQEQRVQNHQNTFYEKVRTIAEKLYIGSSNNKKTKVKKNNKTIKDKVQKKIQGNLEKEMVNKTRLRTVREEKCERKEYIATCDRCLVKDLMKIRLHAWELKKNYPREKADVKFPICNLKKGKTEQ